MKELKEWEMAEQLLRVGMTAFPEEAVFPLLLGQAMVEQGRNDEAVPWFERTLTLSPQSSEAYYGLGRMALDQGKTGEAVRYLKRGLRYDPYARQMLELLHQLLDQV
jgi:predicted Zn-dependent protease